MHQLTIDRPGQSASVTDHDDFQDAHRALIAYVVGADYYLHALDNTTAATTYEMLIVPENHGGPTITGLAIIEQRTAVELPVSAPYFAACEARRWITDHQVDWDFGDPRRYPVAVLSMAQGEARYTLRAGALITEAASLAGATESAPPKLNTLEAVRRNAIENTASVTSPAQIATAVQQLLPAGATAQQAAALTWYYALIQWGVNAS
ncbi:hypothetical protein FZI85_27835 [Mycobacterium sp. CBMA293]|uniref:Uncharacterized protein n=1 Tax=Mycolicibacterium sp. CBMA 213 TaxID=1968788 RepID=A0A1S6GKV7_9MYCO|nr:MULTISPECIES: hypothetical protein [unclassified Mycolicibacterium]AQS22505.1 hypothetical protein pCBMA213_2_00141 [Mycolicibacterium sp. CBMA 213]MUL48405.1 hypothetical protein [Mycolicibacterium sp. CBMA 360]MUL62417.1 hypothetical protein [Mycolicibacterium sp. CBMA 335]MUM04554.1 hypothetical protein [Mycolicibacterium sp. CBMA 213]MUM14817.1 hypothetical protein [Mycolicibacterium sp. CBMA 293]